jgi:hypothetical protein
MGGGLTISAKCLSLCALNLIKSNYQLTSHEISHRNHQPQSVKTAHACEFNGLLGVFYSTVWIDVPSKK